MLGKTVGERRALDVNGIRECFIKVDEIVGKVDREKKIGLDSVILLLWLKRMESVQPRQIVRALSLSSPKVTRCLKRLLRYQFIEEKLDPSDLRVSNMTLASKGWKFTLEAERIVGEHALGELVDFFICFRHMLLIYNNDHPDCKLTESRVRLLMAIAFSDQILTISGLSDFAKFKQPSVSMMIEWLTEKNLVELQKGNEDRRTKTVSLSDSGQAVVCDILNELSLTNLNKLYQK